MSAIIKIIGDIAQSYLQSNQGNNVECRLIIPGPTSEIARGIHEYLLKSNIASYLVIGNDLIPDQDLKWIRPVSLTSRRIGSFVAVIIPGQLAHVQDSIRGSGGTIRSLAFSEEWPWIDNGNETFRFNGPVLERLVEQWSPITEIQQWLRTFVLEGLLNHTRTMSSRATIFLEDTIGTFDPTLYPDITDVRRKMLFHAGIPAPSLSSNIDNVHGLIQVETRLCQQIIERCQREDGIREQVQDMVAEVVQDESEWPTVRSAIDEFMDGLGITKTQLAGILSLRYCWGSNRFNPANWVSLDSDRLARLFSVKERPKADVSYTIECPRGHYSPERKVLATFMGEDIRIIVKYNIPEVDFNGSVWELCLLYRGRKLFGKNLHSATGTEELTFTTSDLSMRYSGKILLRLALTSNRSVVADERLNLHLCGEERPAFVVIDPIFDVVDPTTNDEDDTPDKKFETEEIVQVYLFDCRDEEIHVNDIDDRPIEIVETGLNGIWRSAQSIDPSAELSGQLTMVCWFGGERTILSFEAKDVEKGEFTLEDDLRVKLTTSRDDSIRELYKIFAGNSTTPYLKLGRINDASRARSNLALQMTSRLGWRPVLTNLLDLDQRNSGTIGNYVSHVGTVDSSGFDNLALPEEATRLLYAYTEARDAVLKKISESIDTRGYRVDHPLYASHPVFTEKESGDIELLITSYMDCYASLLDYLFSNQHSLEWPQLFVMIYLDCVVHWDNSPLKNSIFLVGPWHPLVLAKRFMVQSALFGRAKRYCEDQHKSLSQLSSLLERVHGFRLLAGLSADERSFEPLYVSATSDPGWHVAIKIGIGALVSNTTFTDLDSIFDRLKENYDFDTGILVGAMDSLATSCISSYMKAYPSRRSLSVRVSRGYPLPNTVQSVDRFLHKEVEDEPTDQGIQLPGGIDLLVEAEPGNIQDVKWFNPPLRIYRYSANAGYTSQVVPDIYLLPPSHELSFGRVHENYQLPRGERWNTVFSVPLHSLTEGQSLVPRSISYEFDSHPVSGEDLGATFVNTLLKLSRLYENCPSTVRSIDLPRRLHSRWAIAPGGELDPAIFVKYARDGISRSIEERALWDYRVDIGINRNSYFVLSTIPRSFSVVVNGFFHDADVARDFIIDLGNLGIAIGGEALKSGRYALGIIGLVGAVRLLVGGGEDHISPLQRQGSIGFLIPVDSFSSFFGHMSADNEGELKRTDLLVIQLKLPRKPNDKVRIRSCGVESKFVSHTFGQGMALQALEQAQATVKQIKELVDLSLEDGHMPERLALLALLKFGLRISSPSAPLELPNWLASEQVIYEAILQGRYEYEDSRNSAILITTEGNFRGVAEANPVPQGLWIRLNRDHWPDVHESSYLDNIRNKLNKYINEYRDMTPLPVVTTEAPSISPAPQPPISPPRPAASTPEDTQPSVGEFPLPGGTIVEGPSAPLRQILLGMDSGRRAVYWDPKSLIDPLDNLNVMITGSSGTGKTQLLKYLICQLRRQNANVLILDFKRDFASDSVFADHAHLDRVFVNFDGLPFNPLIPYPVRHPGTGELVVQCGQHIAGVVAVLRQTYRLGDQQQAAVRNAIGAAFSRQGIEITGSTRYEEIREFPDFSGVGYSLRESNMAAYNRLDPLFTLDLFREAHRSDSFHSLVDRSVILDLSQIPSDEIKNALAQLVVMSAHMYYNSQEHTGTVRQVLVFDEAHRVLNSDYLLRLVRECRAYGVGTILSSQYPRDFPPDIHGSMATKILHGHGGSVEHAREIVQLVGCDGREVDAQGLQRFQAFVDNRHNPHTIVRTMHYPLYLLWYYLQEHGPATREVLSGIDGLDINKLPLGNLIQQLERLGLAEERDGQVILLVDE